MADNRSWQRMESLLERGFSHEELLYEIMHALSRVEAEGIFDHIERMHGISEDDEELLDEDEEQEDDDPDEDE